MKEERRQKNTPNKGNKPDPVVLAALPLGTLGRLLQTLCETDIMKALLLLDLHFLIIAGVLVAGCQPASNGNDTAIQTEKKDEGIPFVQLVLGKRVILKEDLERYLRVHKIFVGTTVEKARETHRAHYPSIHFRQTVRVDEIIRGRFKDTLSIGYLQEEDSDRVPIGSKFIVVGDWHKTGFNVAVFGSYSEEGVKDLRQYISTKKD